MFRSDKQQFRATNFRVVRAALLAGFMLAAYASQAQSFQVLHNFTGGRDGANPTDGLTIDQHGNLYGTASSGGNQVSGCSNSLGTYGCGSVFELARSGSGWILKPLYDFQGGTDADPALGVTFGPDGALYGLTAGTSGSCSNEYGCGGVYRLAPPPTICPSFTCNWQETVLHLFSGQPDGSSPTSRLLFDSTGNLYGTTFFGGSYNDGAAYELSPGNGGWTESVIYSFNEGNLGKGVALPAGYLAIDQTNNLYGASYCNDTIGCFYGAVFELQHSQSGWSVTPLYQFDGYNGYAPISVYRDPSGNLYGVNTGDGSNESGNIYEVSPSNGAWTFNMLYDFGGFGEDNASGLVVDSAGNVYGVNSSLFNAGYVFKLTPSGSGWTFTTLHTFGGADGSGPYGQLVLDSSGNLYGTTESGGLTATA